MQRILIVGLGGFIGTIGRYGLGTLVARLKGAALFPLETLAVNVVGCLAIGVLAEVVAARSWVSTDLRAFLFIGVLGGFTTFSTFGFETFALVRDGQVANAALSIALQIVLGIGAVWAGVTVARAAWGS